MRTTDHMIQCRSFFWTGLNQFRTECGNITASEGKNLKGCVVESRTSKYSQKFLNYSYRTTSVLQIDSLVKIVSDAIDEDIWVQIINILNFCAFIIRFHFKISHKESHVENLHWFDKFVVKKGHNHSNYEYVFDVGRFPSRYTVILQHHTYKNVR